MNSVPLARAKAQLSELVRRASDGEPTQITVHGEPVAQITSLDSPKKPIDLDALRKLRESMPMQTESAVDLIRRMRDDEP